MEKSVGAEQLNNATQKLNKIAQQNVTTSVVLAKISEEMTTLANHLREVISYLKVN